ncbi:hypothetical protein AXF42_Ash017259 [Apostasia shenzhenica]|uniref:Uncharacterized protein n=1 Tax=Apostasia shenzhenica TaxID=1088818 RepID=A0A2H9ZVL4_9ASPA|nr:hypothetical protein AXF42_Ash017259 [Apostasia shenzhenica]
MDASSCLDIADDLIMPVTPTRTHRLSLACSLSSAFFRAPGPSRSLPAGAWPGLCPREPRPRRPPALRLYHAHALSHTCSSRRVAPASTHAPFAMHPHTPELCRLRCASASRALSSRQRAPVHPKPPQLSISNFLKKNYIVVLGLSDSGAVLCLSDSFLLGHHPTLTLHPLWPRASYAHQLPPGSSSNILYAVGSSSGNAIYLLDFFPDASSPCHVDHSVSDENEGVGVCQNRYIPVSEDVLVCAAHPEIGTIIAGSKVRQPSGFRATRRPMRAGRQWTRHAAAGGLCGRLRITLMPASRAAAGGHAAQPLTRQRPRVRA